MKFTLITLKLVLFGLPVGYKIRISLRPGRTNLWFLCSEFLKHSTQRTQVRSTPQSLQLYVGSPLLNSFPHCGITSLKKEVRSVKQF